MANLRRRAEDLLPRRFDPADVAICTVHGNNETYSEEVALEFPWAELQIERLRRFTPTGYTVYAYANDLVPQHEDFLRSCPEVRVFSTTGRFFPSLRSFWAIRNWLARQAVLRHRFIVHLDSDAFPVHPDWLRRYTRMLSWRCPVIAVQRLENGDTHSDRCFMMYRRVDDRRHRLDFSNIGVMDSGASISATLEERGLSWRPLRRSNAHDYHPLMAALYDDRIYHHAAGSREPHFRQNTELWVRSSDVRERERRLHRWLMERLFRDPDGLIAELRGERVPADPASGPDSPAPVASETQRSTGIPS